MRVWQMGLIASVAVLTVGAFVLRQTMLVPATNPDKPNVPSVDEQRGLELVNLARKMFDDELADYPSARFKDVHAVHYLFGLSGRTYENGTFTHEQRSDVDSYALCGSVNAKNGVGGYIGWTPFAVDSNGLHIVAPTVPNEIAIVASLCSGHGDAAEAAIRQIDAGKTIIAATRRFQVSLDPLNPAEDDPKTIRMIQDDGDLEDKLKTNWFPVIPHHWDWAKDYSKEIAWRQQ